MDNPLAGDHKRSDVEVHVSQHRGTFKELAIKEDALVEVDEEAEVLDYDEHERRLDEAGRPANEERLQLQEELQRRPDQQECA